MNSKDDRPRASGPSVLRSIGVKLFGWFFAVMLIVFGVFAYLSFQSTSEQWMQSMRQSAHRTSKLIERAIHDGMLLNRKDDVHATIRSIAKSPGMAGIRIYDKKGTIIFSADEKEIGRRVDRRAEACVRCHEQNQPLRSLPNKDRVRVFLDADGRRVLGLINPIQNEPSCSNAPCHAHPKDQSILGVLDVKMNIAYIDVARRKAKRDMLIVLLLMAIAGGIAAALFIYRVVRVPVRHLTDGMRKISTGELDTQIQIHTGDEMGDLARSLNRMAGALAEAERAKSRFAEELERKVDEKTAELTRIQGQIAHMEKMASLGKLAATVAHELNNPLAGILVYAKLVLRQIKEAPDLPVADNTQRHLELIRQETARCGDIVKNLLVFARESRVRVAEHHLNEIVERSVMLLQHRIDLEQLEADVQLLDGNDSIVCDGDQIQQALVALLVNALEAMESGGTLTVRTGGGAKHVFVDVGDTGPGIPDDIRPHIFEPFYSTKEESKGVGIGLAVVYGIVHGHGGHVDLDTAVGRGSTFRVMLPRVRTPPSDSGEASDAEPGPESETTT